MPACPLPGAAARGLVVGCGGLAGIAFRLAALAQRPVGGDRDTTAEIVPDAPPAAASIRRVADDLRSCVNDGPDAAGAAFRLAALAQRPVGVRPV